MARSSQRLTELYPPERRTARHMLPLVEAAERARNLLHQRVTAMDAGPSTFAKRDILRELRRLRNRLDVYRDELAKVKPTDPIPDSVRPLLFKFLDPPKATDQMQGTQYLVPTPDALTTETIAAMIGALASHVHEMEGVFWTYLAEELKKLPAKGAKIVKDVVVDVVEEVKPDVNWPIVIGVGAGVLVVGGFAYASTRRSS